MQRGPVNRRRVLAASGAMAGALALPGGVGSSSPKDSIRDAHARPILFQGGIVVTGEETAGVVPKRQDVLVRGDRIEAVGTDLPGRDARVFDCRGRIVTVPWIDTHVHGWERLLRYRADSLGFLDYLGTITGEDLSRMSAQDIALGEYAEAVSALDAGVGTMVSWCHAIRTRDDALTVLRKLYQAGGWTVFMHGYNSLMFTTANPGPNLPDVLTTFREAQRLRSNPSGGGIVKAGMAVVGPEFTPDLSPITAQVKWLDDVNRKLDTDNILSLHDGIPGPHDARPGVKLMKDAGLLRRNQLHVHGVVLTDEELGALARTGSGLSLSPAIDARVFGGVLAHDRATRAGVPPAVSSDDAAIGGFTLRDHVRALMTAQHQSATAAQQPLMTDADALATVTRNAAAALGLDRMGVLRKGYQADIMLIDARRLDVGPVMAATAVGAVLAAPAAAITHLMLGGRWRKYDGRLLGVDVDRLLDDVTAAIQRIITR
jgi:5-methylthioadenosine/S-adenosylhomocysteine deaminase